MKRWPAVAVVAVIAVAAIGSVTAFGRQDSRKRSQMVSGGVAGGVAAPAHPSAFFNAAGFAQARARAGAPRPVAGARAVIVPHHWVGGHLIVGGVRDLLEGSGAQRVIVLGPNHIGAGGALVTTSGQAWSTPLGRLEADGKAVTALARAGVATVSPRVLTHEHSMAGMMPSIASAAPAARVVPLAVRPGLRLSEARRLAGALVPLLEDPQTTTVLVASVDFSHYLPVDVARRHDRESLDVLRRLDSAKAITWSDEHFDSPGSIATLLETMRAVGATRFELRANTSSAEILGPGPAGTTTYISGFFVSP